MPYSKDNLPDWLKNLPQGAIQIGIEVFNETFDRDKDEEAARQAAWSAIKAKYEKTDNVWRAKAEIDKIFQTALRMDKPADIEGSAWEVTICEPGLTLNDWYLPEEALREAAGLFEGVDVNLYELPEKGASHVPDNLFEIKPLLVKNKIGWIDKVRYAAGQGLKGILHFLDSAKWLGRNLLKAQQAGVQAYGLSYDCPVTAKREEINGKPAFSVIKFLAADSVDIVSRPAAGGNFNRAVAAQKMEEQVMDKKTLWNLIHEKQPDLLAGKDFKSISDEEITALARMAMESKQDKKTAYWNLLLDKAPRLIEEKDFKTITEQEVVALARAAMDPPSKPEPKPNTVTQGDLSLFRCEMALDKAINASDLPDKARTRIQAMFAKKIFESAELERAIASEKDYLAEISGVNKGPGDNGGIAASSITVGLGSLERAQMAADRAFGLTKDDEIKLSKMTRLDNQPFFESMRSVQDYQDFDQVPAFTGIHEMYVFFTGDTEVAGRFFPKKLPPDLRAKMDITSATFSYVLGNTLARRLVKDYLATNFQEDLLVSIRKSVKDFRQQEAVLVGYFGDLDTVDPEAADYTEIAAVTDEESTYTMAQKGNILTVTRKTIINDDISLVQRLVERLGRAARRTHAQYVWNFWINNSTCSDGTAWFTVGHGNLLALALTYARAITAYKTLAKMTEKDSAKRIGLLDDPNVKPTLIYPIDLMETGDQIVNDDHYYTANDLTTKTRNPLKGLINGAMVSILTDADDWGLLLPAGLIDIVEMGYLNGRQEPEMFVADSPQSEQIFIADKVRYKIRHEYAGAPIDFRSGYKSEV